MIRRRITGFFRWLMSPINNLRGRIWLRRNAPKMRQAMFEMLRRDIADTQANGTAEDQLLMYAMLGHAAGAGKTSKPAGK